MGIELSRDNLDAVVEALQSLHDLDCAPGHRGCGYAASYRGPKSADQVREMITNIEAISDVQRRVLLEMVELGPS